MPKPPLFTSSVPAGFPSPADDYIEQKLDLNKFLIKKPAATFFVRAEGDSMSGAGIHSGDILIVDRSLAAEAGQIVVAVLDGEFTVKRIQKTKNKLFLTAENSHFKPIKINPNNDLSIWGVVTCVIHSTL